MLDKILFYLNSNGCEYYEFSWMIVSGGIGPASRNATSAAAFLRRGARRAMPP